MGRFQKVEREMGLLGMGMRMGHLRKLGEEKEQEIKGVEKIGQILRVVEEEWGKFKG